MKKKAPVALTLAALCALAAVAGCGQSGDVDQAVNLVKSGNEDYKAFEEEFMEVTDLSEKLFSRYSHGVETDPAEAARLVQDYQDRFNRLLEQVKQAREPYQKVLAMDGVETYKEYADLRLKMLDKIDAAGAVVSRTLPMITKTIQTQAAPDAAALEGSKRELIGVEMELSFTEAEAEQLAKETGLLE